MARRWSNLSPRSRRLIVIAGAVEGTIKLAALADLWRRPEGQVRGSKVVWAVAIVLVKSGGLLPLVYLARGRRRAATSSV